MVITDGALFSITMDSGRASDPDPVGSCVFAWIRIWFLKGVFVLGHCAVILCGGHLFFLSKGIWIEKI